MGSNDYDFIGEAAVAREGLVGLMRTEENVVVAGGQGKLARDIFRIGHLGYVTKEDILEVFQALERVLPKVGFNAGKA